MTGYITQHAIEKKKKTKPVLSSSLLAVDIRTMIMILIIVILIIVPLVIKSACHHTVLACHHTCRDHHMTLSEPIDVVRLYHVHQCHDHCRSCTHYYHHHNFLWVSERKIEWVSHSRWRGDRMDTSPWAINESVHLGNPAHYVLQECYRQHVGNL